MTPPFVIRSTPPPVLGTWHEWVYPAGVFEIELMGYVTQVTPPQLVLEDIQIYAKNQSGRAPVGTLQVMRCRNAFLVDLGAMGYTSVRLIGQRISGSSPGRLIDLTLP